MFSAGCFGFMENENSHPTDKEMESLENYRPSTAFLAYLDDCINRPKAAEPKEEVSTIDGDIISSVAMKQALKAGKGVMIGGFFVGSTGNSDMEFGYSLSI